MKQDRLCQLQAWLEEVESRLGTNAERPDDIDRAQSLLQQVNNARGSHFLRREPDRSILRARTGKRMRVA